MCNGKLGEIQVYCAKMLPAGNVRDICLWVLDLLVITISLYDGWGAVNGWFLTQCYSLTLHVRCVRSMANFDISSYSTSGADKCTDH